MAKPVHRGSDAHPWLTMCGINSDQALPDIAVAWQDSGTTCQDCLDTMADVVQDALNPECRECGGAGTFHHRSVQDAYGGTHMVPERGKPCYHCGGTGKEPR